MNIAAEQKKALVEFLLAEPVELALTCEQCGHSIPITGPFTLRHPFACAECGKQGVVNILRQVDQMVEADINRFESRMVALFDEQHAAAPGGQPQPAAPATHLQPTTPASGAHDSSCCGGGCGG